MGGSRPGGLGVPPFRRRGARLCAAVLRLVRRASVGWPRPADAPPPAAGGRGHRQGRLTLPGRLREAVDIDKDVVVLGVRDRMEIWDRASYERYEATYAGAYQAGTSQPGRAERRLPTAGG